ncbi:MAG: hypothetical protein JRF51_08800 [Deltaproteobacteria bacterium]|nr:hypothetical protein [Deltaproteobacteria bacterium]
MFSLKRKPERTEKGSSHSFFSVMVLRGLGRVRTFNISSRLLIGAGVAVGLYTVLSLVAIFHYFGDLGTRGDRLDLLAQLEHEIEVTKKKLYGARQRLKFLEDYVGGAEGKDGKQTERPGPEMTEPAPVEGKSREKNLKPAERGGPSGPVVGVRNLTTRKTGNRLSVKFRLVKVKPDGNQTTGYIFMIASDTASDPPRLWSHPRTTLKNGEPVDYKQGQVFKVRNYRTIRGKYSFDSETETPSLLTILVYDESGRLTLRKRFPIEDSE